LALITPVIITPILPFSSNTAKTIPFLSSGGSQVTGNIIKVYNNSTDELIYTNNSTSFLLQNTIPENTLINGETYRVTIQTKDISDNLSNESDAVIFYVLSNPEYLFTNIDFLNNNKVYNQNITFSCNYSQVESEILQSYIYNLYDQNQSLLQSYPNTFANGSSPLTQLIQGLANNTPYYVEVKTVSVNGQIGSSGLIEFTPFYISPNLFSTLTTTPDLKTGSIKVEAIILQLIGVMDTGTVIYQDDTWIDLTQGGQVSFSEGFSVNQSEFVLKFWCKNIPVDAVFLKLYSPDGRIEFYMDDESIHAYGYLNGLTSRTHFISNTVTIGVDNEFLLYVKSKYNLLDLIITLL